MKITVWHGCRVVAERDVPGPDFSIGVDPWSLVMSVDGHPYDMHPVSPAEERA